MKEITEEPYATVHKRMLDKILRGFFLGVQ
jgi:hypothetical protein